MAYDEELAQRFRDAIDGVPGISEKRMMGATCFMVNGNMIGAADRTRDGVGRFMFRPGKAREAEALARAGASPMDITGRPMSGFVWVEADAAVDAGLAEWFDFCAAFVGSLPPRI